MYQGFEPRGIYDRYEKINELLHRAAVTAEPLELPLVRLKLVRIGFLGIFPNHTYSWHEHPYYELITVREGRASYFSEELSFSCDAGNRFFTATPPMTPHQLKFGPERIVLFAVNFEMEPRNPVGEQLIRLTPELLRERNSRLVPRERLWTLYSLLNSPEQTECGQVELTALYTRLFFGELLFELLPELFADRLPGRRHPHFDFEHDRINAIKAFIDHDINVRGCLPIEREFGMSERHLNRIFKAATGWSIGSIGFNANCTWRRPSCAEAAIRSTKSARACVSAAFHSSARSSAGTAAARPGNTGSEPPSAERRGRISRRSDACGAEDFFYCGVLRHFRGEQELFRGGRQRAGFDPPLAGLHVARCEPDRVSSRRQIWEKPSSAG